MAARKLLTLTRVLFIIANDMAHSIILVDPNGESTTGDIVQFSDTPDDITHYITSICHPTGRTQAIEVRIVTSTEMWQLRVV